MNDFKVELKYKGIEFLYKILVSGEAYKEIVKLASGLMDEDKTNDEKRKEVKDAVMPMVRSFGKFILSSVIAFIVDMIKLNIEKRTSGAN